MVGFACVKNSIEPAACHRSVRNDSQSTLIVLTGDVNTSVITGL